MQKNLQLGEKTTMRFSIYYIGYVDKKPEWNLNSVNLFYLIINILVDFIEEKDGDKYFNISDADRNSEVLKKYMQKFRMELKAALKK